MLKRLIISILLISTGFFYGMLCFQSQLPPYKTLETIKHFWKIHREPDDRWQALQDLNIDELLELPDQAALKNLHQQLIRLLWNQRDPFTAKAIVSEKPIVDTAYSDITSLSSIYQLKYVMAFGIDSNAYWFKPKTNAIKACVLVNPGHGGDFIILKSIIKDLLDQDYCVVAMSMPLSGQNNQPWVTLAHLGPLHLTLHNHLAYLTMPDGGLPLQLFIEPVIAMVSFLQQQTQTPIFMLGLSGGGWTTLMSAAVDPRITKSIVVAGDLPMTFRANDLRDGGDYEQHDANFQKHFNSFQLHALSATAGRKQVVIYNEFDACCYAGRAGLMFIPPIQKRLAQLQQGQLHLYIDNTHNQHQISPAAQQLIMQELDQPANKKPVAPVFFSKPYQPWKALMQWLFNLNTQD